MADESPLLSSAVKASAGVLAAGILAGVIYLIQLQPRIDVLERDVRTNQAVIAASLRESTLKDAELQKLAEEFRLRLQALMGSAVEFVPDRHLRAATHREILMRILTNLKHIAFRAKDFERALASCERIVLLTPDAPLELRDRGLAYEQQGAFGAALRDFERFLELAPNNSTARAIEDRAAQLHERVKRLH